ncbi:MAG: endonuclease III [Planctomycetota bacterium]
MGEGQIRRLYDRLAAHIEPRSELLYQDPFELLVAVVLSAQATDVSVNAATARLFPVANTPQAIWELGLDGLIPYIRTIGLFNSKARNIIALCRILLDQHEGRVPAERDALEALPGVGRKTASVVLNVAFGVPCIAVDTHIQRVANRTGMAVTTRPDHTQAVLEARTPHRHLRDAHHYLILHGRYTCTARRPHCSTCTIRRICQWPEKTA